MFKTKSTTKLMFLTKESNLYAEILNPRYNLFPDWWRGLNKQDIPTMKTCPGFVDLLKTTITVPLWKDYHIRYSDKIENISVPGVTDKQQMEEWIHFHPSEQYGNHFNNYLHLKLKNPWMTICNDNTRFLMTDATWHRDQFESYSVLTGELEFRYQSSCHVNIFIPKSKTTQVLKLEAGDPICYLKPLTDRTVEIEAKKVSTEEWFSYIQMPFTFQNQYRKILKLIKQRS
jgi:hypothetical protein|tara:strand:- start:354 stop:1043 length:690 start_codon:yes stop_codon:yes gene_type:complete